MSFRSCLARKFFAAFNFPSHANTVCLRHALRQSGAFTNLDFAPPPRFKNAETASDAGSIRSNGTGLSNAQLHNIRNGAYRVSRLPADTVGTKDDMFSELRPKWDMRT